MTTVDQSLLDAASAALGVHDVMAVGAQGGQKAVRQVERNGGKLIMKVIAIKSSSPSTLTRAEREVELLAGLASKHVVRVESELQRLGNPVNGAAWLEELLDGEDLTAQLGTPWTWQDTVDMAAQVADGLAAAHDKSVIHRDLSPNNVRRLSDGTFRVMDFGFARFTLQTGITVGGQPGTYGYHSPEHLNAYSGAPIAASDVFGVGILMYQARTGTVPIPYSGDDSDYARRLSRAETADLATLRPDLDDDQLAFMRKILHPQPARRFRNGRQLATALEVL